MTSATSSSIPVCGKKFVAAQHSPAAHTDQVHTSAARVDEGRYHVNVAGATFHALLVLDTAQQGDLVA